MPEESPPRRLQTYFDVGLFVYRAAPGVDPTIGLDEQDPPPKLVCTATSKAQAQKISAALNRYVPNRERRAITRQIVSDEIKQRADKVKKAFKGK